VEELYFQLITLQGLRAPKPDHIRQWFDLVVAEGKRNTPPSCCRRRKAKLSGQPTARHGSSRRSHSGLR